LALAEAYRNVACSGAVPLAVTDCLNFGSPESPGSMWQLVEAMTGLADACQVLGVPVTGGNVSLYNETGEPGLIDSAIHPTPVVGVLGVHDDVARAIPSGWAAAGLAVYLLGTTRAELGGSAWADVVHGHLGGRPPAVDLAAERALAQVLIAAAREGVVAAAHDLSEGGLAQGLAEACLRFGIGAEVDVAGVMARDGVSAFEVLFSESQARALVAVAPGAAEVRLADLAATHGVPAIRLGVTGARANARQDGTDGTGTCARGDAADGGEAAARTGASAPGGAATRDDAGAPAGPPVGAPVGPPAGEPVGPSVGPPARDRGIVDPVPPNPEALVLTDLFTIPLPEAREAFDAPLPSHFAT
jgi:phosphoribosylformylglycinamidine synthase